MKPWLYCNYVYMYHNSENR